MISPIAPQPAESKTEFPGKGGRHNGCWCCGLEHCCRGCHADHITHTAVTDDILRIIDTQRSRYNVALAITEYISRHSVDVPEADKTSKLCDAMDCYESWRFSLAIKETGRFIKLCEYHYRELGDEDE